LDAKFIATLKQPESEIRKVGSLYVKLKKYERPRAYFSKKAEKAAK
jgi:hypothetical protein